MQKELAISTKKIPPHTYFLISAIFHYLGPSFAVLLFAYVSELGVAWLRIASAGLIFAIWRRPWRMFRELTSSQRNTLVALGVVLGLMNAVFYLAIARLPLGTVGAIEFIGPITLAALGMKTKRNFLALILAAAGGCLLANVQLEGEPLAVIFAFVNCGLFMLYVILGHRIAQDGNTAGIDRLGVAMLVALVTVSPIGFKDALPTFGQPKLLFAGIGVGVCSSVIPYVCDQLAMARLSRSTFALLLSLLPVFATVIGVIVLKQIPTPVEMAGILLVVFGVAIHKEYI